MRKLSVAAIQATSRNGQLARNLDNADRLVRRAAGRGAELVVCPEFLATGYTFDESIWDAAEPLWGATEQWLARISDELEIVVGAGFLEVDGTRFWNTFSLFGPGGELLGRVRKGSLPFFEGWYFQPCPKTKVLATPVGRVAIGICADNQTADFYRHVVEEQPDLVLMPHSSPTPSFRVFERLFGPIWKAQVDGAAGRYARALGVPVVMANKVSFETETTRLPIAPGLRLPWRFHGYSAIWDGDGVMRGRLVDEEDALVCEITLDPTRKQRLSPPPRRYLSHGPRLLDRTVGPLLKVLASWGQRAYDRSPRRVAAAQRASLRAAAPAKRTPPSPP